MENNEQNPNLNNNERRGSGSDRENNPDSIRLHNEGSQGESGHRDIQNVEGNNQQREHFQPVGILGVPTNPNPVILQRILSAPPPPHGPIPIRPIPIYHSSSQMQPSPSLYLAQGSSLPIYDFSSLPCPVPTSSASEALEQVRDLRLRDRYGPTPPSVMGNIFTQSFPTPSPLSRPRGNMFMEHRFFAPFPHPSPSTYPRLAPVFPSPSTDFLFSSLPNVSAPVSRSVPLLPTRPTQVLDNLLQVTLHNSTFHLTSTTSSTISVYPTPPPHSNARRVPQIIPVRTLPTSLPIRPIPRYVRPVHQTTSRHSLPTHPIPPKIPPDSNSIGRPRSQVPTRPSIRSTVHPNTLIALFSRATKANSSSSSNPSPFVRYNATPKNPKRQPSPQPPATDYTPVSRSSPQPTGAYRPPCVPSRKPSQHRRVPYQVPRRSHTTHILPQSIASPQTSQTPESSLIRASELFPSISSSSLPISFLISRPSPLPPTAPPPSATSLLSTASLPCPNPHSSSVPSPPAASPISTASVPHPHPLHQESSSRESTPPRANASAAAITEDNRNSHLPTSETITNEMTRLKCSGEDDPPINCKRKAKKCPPPPLKIINTENQPNPNIEPITPPSEPEDNAPCAPPPAPNSSAPDPSSPRLHTNHKKFQYKEWALSRSNASTAKVTKKAPNAKAAKHCQAPIQSNVKVKVEAGNEESTAHASCHNIKIKTEPVGESLKIQIKTEKPDEAPIASNHATTDGTPGSSGEGRIILCVDKDNIVKPLRLSAFITEEQARERVARIGVAETQREMDAFAAIIMCGNAFRMQGSEETSKSKEKKKPEPSK